MLLFSLRVLTRDVPKDNNSSENPDALEINTPLDEEEKVFEQMCL